MSHRLLNGFGLTLSISVAMLAALAVPTTTAVATTAGPTVIAVHRNGAIDVAGNGTYGTVASMSLPAGNWLISATATVQTTTSISQQGCELIAGSDSYVTSAIPTGGGIGASQPIELLLGHHYAKKGSATMKCYTDGWLGSALIRDVHMSAVNVASLLTGDTVYGTGSPAAFYGQAPSLRGWTNTNYQDVQDIALPAGRWLVQAVAWGGTGGDGDRIDCSLQASSATADASITDFEGVQRGLAVEGVLTLSTADHATMWCKDALGLWYVYGSAISALQVGTLKYGQIGSISTTTGSGTPSVVGGFAGAGGITDSTTPASIGSVALGAGSWLVTSKLSLQEGASTPNVTCQLKLSSAADQGRVVLDSGSNSINWMGPSLTKKLSGAANASVVCNQSGGSLGAFYADLKVFALKAGSLTDTNLE